MISAKKRESIQKRMLELCIYESDLLEKYSIGSGKGGQKAQKSYNSVFIKHIPTGCTASSHASRAREENRFLARRVLCEKIAVQRGLSSLTIEKHKSIRKQKKRRVRRNKKKI